MREKHVFHTLGRGEIETEEGRRIFMGIRELLGNPVVDYPVVDYHFDKDMKPMEYHLLGCECGRLHLICGSWIFREAVSAATAHERN